jgi:hypothetical protein
MATAQMRQWSGGWSMQTADLAYQLILSAGHGNATAKGQLDAIKALAAKGDATAMKIMTYFTPIAKMVALNLGPPSKLHARRMVGVLPRASQLKQQQQLRKMQEELKMRRLAQIQDVKKRSLMTKMKQRMQQDKDATAAQLAAAQAQSDAEANMYEDKLAAVQRELENRDVGDAQRQQLEEQAAQFEAEIDRIKAERAAQVAPPTAAAPASQPAIEAPPSPPTDMEYSAVAASEE